MRWIPGAITVVAVGLAVAAIAPAWAQEAPAPEEAVVVEAPAPEATPLPYWLTLPYNGPFRPDGPDKDCGDFQTWEEAQGFFLAAGGPEADPHRLDQGGLPGIACEALRGTIVRNGTIVGTPTPGPQR